MTDVDPNGPAAEAGIEPRRVITAVGSERIEDSGDLLAALRDHRPGDRVELTVANGGEGRRATVELGERGYYSAFHSR